MPEDITAMALLVTERCNLACVYCYGLNGNHRKQSVMKLNTAIKAVDWLIQKSGDRKNLRLTFFGGEPLLQFEMIREIAGYTKKAISGHDKQITFEMTTNATLMSTEVIQFLKEYKIKPLISFDGPEEIQNKQRPFINGRGSYKIARPLIRELLQEIPGISCRATWLPGNDPQVILDGLNELGFSNIYLLPATLVYEDSAGTPDGFLEPLIKIEEKRCRELKAAVRSRNDAEIKEIGKTSLILRLAEMKIKKIKKERPCGAGRELVAVSSKGDLYPCHRFAGMEEFRLGNVLTGECANTFNFWKSVDEIPSCKACPARYTCAGGCYHDNLVSTGDYKTPGREVCRRRVAIDALAAELIAGFDESDVQFLYQEAIFKEKYCPMDFN